MFRCQTCREEFEFRDDVIRHQEKHPDSVLRYSYRAVSPSKECLSCGEIVGHPKVYCNSQCMQDHVWQETVNQINEGVIFSDKVMKRYLLDLSPKCSECPVGEFYNGKDLTLQLDHIDGNSDNNSLSNLRILCPNCHSQTETWCARNAKNSKRSKHARIWREAVKQNKA